MTWFHREQSGECIRFSNHTYTDCYSKVVSSSTCRIAYFRGYYSLHTADSSMSGLTFWPYILAVPSNGLRSVFVAFTSHTVNFLKISNIFLFLYSNKRLAFEVGIHKKLVRKANREDPDQKKQSGQCLRCLFRPFVTGN